MLRLKATALKSTTFTTKFLGPHQRDKSGFQMLNAWCERTENSLLKVAEGRLTMGESVTVAKDTLKLPA